MMPFAHLSRCCSRRIWIGVWSGLTVFSIASLAAMFSASTSAVSPEAKSLRHVVEFKFKDSSSKEQISEVVQAFRLLPSKISAVADFEYGVDNSPEGLANGFTHCFLLTFGSEADRGVYLKHPEHMKFVDILKPHLDQVQVIDYWAQK
jgi:hypothetical protein